MSIIPWHKHRRGRGQERRRGGGEEGAEGAEGVEGAEERRRGGGEEGAEGKEEGR